MTLPNAAVFKLNTDSTTAAWDHRLPAIAQTVGPKSLNEFVTGNWYEWNANVDYRTGRVSLNNSTGFTTALTIPLRASQFGFAFDLNGRIAYSYQIQNKIYWTYFDDIQHKQVTKEFEGEYPACAIDSYTPREEPPVDVILAYVKDNKLCVRYQRERYDDEHEIAEITGGIKGLRTIGISKDNRFIFRFFSNVGEVTSLI